MFTLIFDRPRIILQNYLLVVDCNLPNEDTEIDVRKYDDEMGTTSGGYGGNDEVDRFF